MPLGCQKKPGTATAFRVQPSGSTPHAPDRRKRCCLLVARTRGPLMLAAMAISSLASVVPLTQWKSAGFSPNGIGLHDIVGNAEEIILACRHRSQDSEEESLRWYGSGHLSPRGSLENPQTCEYYVATMGGSWSVGLTYQSSRSLRVSTDYRPGHTNMGFESPYFRNSQTWTGFRLVRRLP